MFNKVLTYLLTYLNYYLAEETRTNFHKLQSAKHLRHHIRRCTLIDPLWNLTQAWMLVQNKMCTLSQGRNEFWRVQMTMTLSLQSCSAEV